jgi:hypothetical protein
MGAQHLKANPNRHWQAARHLPYWHRPVEVNQLADMITGIGKTCLMYRNAPARNCRWLHLQQRSDGQSPEVRPLIDPSRGLGPRCEARRGRARLRTESRRSMRHPQATRTGRTPQRFQHCAGFVQRLVYAERVFASTSFSHRCKPGVVRRLRKLLPKRSMKRKMPRPTTELESSRIVLSRVENPQPADAGTCVFRLGPIASLLSKSGARPGWMQGPSEPIVQNGRQQFRGFEVWYVARVKTANILLAARGLK